MNIVRAKEMIISLADGINPVTGEVLSEKDSCNQIEVVRALYTILNYIDTHSADSKKGSKIPESSGRLKKRKNFVIDFKQGTQTRKFVLTLKDLQNPSFQD